jgi:hypothetical protein
MISPKASRRSQALRAPVLAVNNNLPVRCRTEERVRRADFFGMVCRNRQRYPADIVIGPSVELISRSNDEAQGTLE